jgi:myo-inositol catabolism protein IolC
LQKEGADSAHVAGVVALGLDRDLEELPDHLDVGSRVPTLRLVGFGVELTAEPPRRRGYAEKT